MVEYFTENIWLLWLFLSIICLIIELSSGDFYVTCAAIGALGGMISAFLDMPLWLQILAFALVTVFSVIFIRPPLLHALHAKGHHRASNIDALIGQIGIVIESISPNHSGYIKVDGDEWKAVSTDCNTIEAGDKVRIMSINSTILTVERCL